MGESLILKSIVSEILLYQESREMGREREISLLELSLSLGPFSILLMIIMMMMRNCV